LNWLKKIISKVAEEVHKSKIEEFNNKVTELISEHKVMTKTIKDNERKIQDLENKVFNAIISSSKMEATITTVLHLKEKEIEQLKLKNND
jgi:predicted xylose isomerase-like sugar epimerase